MEWPDRSAWRKRIFKKAATKGFDRSVLDYDRGDT